MPATAQPPAGHQNVPDSTAPGSACTFSRYDALQEELIARLDAEQPRNHLDLQHRVGPDGKRWGKVIEYK